MREIERREKERGKLVDGRGLGRDKKKVRSERD